MGYRLVMAMAIALHVTDEALTDFLPFYNSIVHSLRDRYAWIPLPTFNFPVWLSGLICGVILLLALAPMVFAGKRFLRPVSYFLGVLMTLNALGHIAGSVYLKAPAPGVISSPVLLFAAVALLVVTARAKGTGTMD